MLTEKSKERVMRKFILFSLCFLGFSANAMGANNLLSNYFDKEGVKVLRYLAKGMEACNQLSTVDTINQVQKQNCEIKARLASQKAKSAGFIIDAEYFLSTEFLYGLAKAVNDEMKFNRMILKNPGAVSRKLSAEFHATSNRILEEFKNGKLR